MFFNIKISKDEIDKFSNIALYRLLIKNVKIYKSKATPILYNEIKSEFKKNRHLTDQKEINLELRKARVGLGHLLMYNQKDYEIRHNYKNSPEEYEPLNPKDENFVYF